jgi:tripartite-type tricarboxylate transporter receptor subunit TctC
VVSRFVAAALVFLVSAVACAQNYPQKPIRMIVPAAAGSSADIGSRFVAQQLAIALGQPVVVENKPGAGGTIGLAALARAAPDGYTIGLAAEPMLVFTQAIYPKPGYDPRKDFSPIALLARAANVLVVHPSNPASTAADIVAAAKAKPGTMTFSSGGSSTSHHLSGVLFSRVTGTDLVHVPYKSAPQAVLAVVTNEVTMGFFNTPLVIGLLKEGKLKAIGVTSRIRSPLLPEVPTLDEQGVKGYEVDTWAGYVAPAGTPSPIVEKLHAELVRINASAQAKQTLARQGFDLAAPLTASEFGKLIADEFDRWMPIVKGSGAKVD